VKVVSLDQAEHASVIQRGGEGKWGEIDGIATYDPTIAAALAQGKARILHAWASPALVVVHQRLIATRRSDLAAFLRAYATAYTLYAANPAQANAWYSEESRLPLDDGDYAAIAEFEPNMQARTLSDVDVRITDTVLAQAKRNAEVALELGIIKSKPDLQALTDRTFFP
jgi:ABC-type nitrate/sulfonate/bicarbonate transport system substrate-binding protein